MTAWQPHEQFQQRREYDDEPCSGMLRLVEQDGPVWIVACDGCDYTAGLPARDADRRLRVQLRSERAGFPAMFAGKPFEESLGNRPVKERIREWLLGFPEAPIPAPAIYGRNGRGQVPSAGGDVRAADPSLRRDGVVPSDRRPAGRAAGGVRG